MFQRCLDDHKYKQAIGIALETRRLDIFEKTILESVCARDRRCLQLGFSRYGFRSQVQDPCCCGTCPVLYEQNKRSLLFKLRGVQFSMFVEGRATQGYQVQEDPPYLQEILELQVDGKIFPGSLAMCPLLKVFPISYWQRYYTGIM